MSYLVLARKWRPQTFRDLIGQEHVSQTLKNAIDSGRVAHAFLFTGGRGVGKTSAARILAKALNCEKGPAPEPCNDCSACGEITAGNSVDVFEIDGASNTSVDDIRELRETVKYLPSRSRYKIFIIDEVHMLSTNAFNALLKTLEEPPSHVKFIFATTEPHKVPITILSRCQRFDFKRISLPMIVARLRFILEQEKVVISDSALAMIARKGDGSMRDSLSTLDQILAFCDDLVSDEEVVSLLGVVDRRLLAASARAVFTRDCPAALDIVRQVDAFGHNMRLFCQELLDYFRNMIILKAAGDPACLSDIQDGELAEIRDMSASVTLADLQRHLAFLLKAESEMAHSAYSRLILEMALLKMATIAPVMPIDGILAEIKALKGRSVDVLASPAPAWNATPQQAIPATRGGGGHSARTKTAEAAPPESSSGDTRCPQTGTSPAKVAEAAARPEDDQWSGFVEYVRGKKPMLASLLEHAHPLSVSPNLMELGFPAGSFQLGQLRDPVAVAELQVLAKGHFHVETGFKLVSVTGETPVPPSILGKKNSEHAGKIEKLKKLAENHPAVVAALDIFGGEIGEIAETNGTDPV